MDRLADRFAISPWPASCLYTVCVAADIYSKGDMEQLIRGQRLPLAQISPSGRFSIGLACQGLALDFACFGLDGAGKLSDERYMTFFNQPASPCGGVRLETPPGDAAGFAIDTGRLPAAIEQLVITASIDGQGVMAQLGSGYLRVMDGAREVARFAFAGADFAEERALMLGSMYRKDGQWRFMAVGQGFNGGLDALVAHFGGTVAQESEAPPRVSLEKRIEREAPQLVNLFKQAGVSLQKVGLDHHRAKVALVLDISGSMGTLYGKGLVQAFAERILALGCKFDDDGEIDVFLFGSKVHQPAPMGLQNARDYVRQAIVTHPLEGDTRYGRAIEAVRRFYFPDGGGAGEGGIARVRDVRHRRFHLGPAADRKTVALGQPRADLLAVHGHRKRQEIEKQAAGAVCRFRLPLPGKTRRTRWSLRRQRQLFLGRVA